MLWASSVLWRLCKGQRDYRHFKIVCKGSLYITLVHILTGGNSMQVRNATPKDAATIANIYNQGIEDCSVYVKRDMRGHGSGRIALEALICAAEESGFWKLVSRVFIENKASRALISSLGFREVGIYEKHAKLDGVWRDVIVVERLIECNLR